MRLPAVIGAVALLLSCSQPAPVRQSGPAGVDYDVNATLEGDLQTGFFQLELRSGKPVEVFYEIMDRDG